MIYCGSEPASETFEYDSQTQQIKSVSKRGLCWHDGSDPSLMQLQLCSTDAEQLKHQQFAFEPVKWGDGFGIVQNVNRPSQCLDDGEAWVPRSTSVQMSACDQRNWDYMANYNQLLSIELVTGYVPEITLPPPPPTPEPTTLTPEPSSWTPEPPSSNASSSVLESIVNQAPLRVRTAKAANLCVTDGVDAFRMLTYGEDSSSETFVYDVVTQHVMSWSKPGWCWDINDYGECNLRLQPCDVQHEPAQYQRFMYNPSSESNALCAPSALGFQELSQALEMSLKSGGWVLTTGQPFYLQSIFKLSPPMQSELPPFNSTRNPDMDDSPMMIPGYASLCLGASDGLMKLMPCEEHTESTLFTYDLATYSLHNAAHPEFCLDDTDADTKGLSLRPCDAFSYNQKFMYNFFTFQWIKAGTCDDEKEQCIDDGGYNPLQHTAGTLRDCNSFGSPTQMTMIVPGPQSELPSFPTNGTPKLFAIEFPFRLRLFSSFLCVADSSTEGGVIGTEPCTFNPAKTQTFVYRKDAPQIRSVAKPWLCLTANTPDNNAVILARCGDTSEDQHFKFDENSGQLTNPHKTGLCVETTGVQSTLALRPCGEKNWRQVFSVEGVSPLPPPSLQVA
ncbi:hypothetical protein Poli38472_001838 [Pythium oligandrum]|uniref:Ricin B lectin domain-containing protein n=1 Tax=Pythium oligandrum TaxID=41045 RepID=A0A8K1CTJ9_PYTOL|nr:hypothetical protein Poli38472_001838 [Pythium oligandrum]|eukprot:TMW69682.1 hypothetical protein Poli38472_001838 [Pythium oligandrum]